MRFSAIDACLNTEGLCTVYWFHPASWLVQRKLRQSREWATDETVVRFGFSSSSYARSIVAIISRLSAEPPNLPTTPAVAISLYGDVEQRLYNIFYSVPWQEKWGQVSFCVSRER